MFVGIWGWGWGGLLRVGEGYLGFWVFGFWFLWVFEVIFGVGFGWYFAGVEWNLLLVEGSLIGSGLLGFNYDL